MAVDFSEFKKQDKSGWLLAAEKALKGKPISSLLWKVDDSISTEPFYTKEETKTQSTLPNTRKNNHWHIGESFNGDDPGQLNDQLLKALAFGLDSPLFFDIESFDACLENVRVDFLFAIFRGGKVSEYLNWIRKEGLDANLLRGGFIAFEAGYDAIDITDNLSNLKFIANHLPKYYHSLLSFALNPENLAASIGRHLVQLSELIYQLKSKEVPVKIICELETDNDYIKTVATIRAIRLMIAEMCKAYEIPQDSILVDAYVNQTVQDIQLGMVGASGQAMAAVTAGIDRLTISCEALDVQQDEEVTRRMTRNIHHLMKMESGLDQVVDPLAGSYSIEELTGQIAQRSWKVFQKGQ